MLSIKKHLPKFMRFLKDTLAGFKYGTKANPKAKGNVISFVSKIENITEDQATIKLAKRLGIQIDEKKNAQTIKEERLIKVMEDAHEFYKFYLKNSDEGKQALEYLYNRGISDEIINEFEIGLSSINKDYLYLALSKKNHNILDAINLGLVKEDKLFVLYNLIAIKVLNEIIDYDYLAEEFHFSGSQIKNGTI